MAAIPSLLSVWDPFGTELRIQAWADCWNQDRKDLATISRRCIRAYEGRQTEDLHLFLDAIFSTERLRTRYKQLSRTVNHLKPLVQKVATIGKRPVGVEWDNELDSRLWELVSTRHLGTPWQKFVPFLDRRKRLVKNVIVAVGWNAAHGRLDLQVHYPHTADVGWYPDNDSWQDPDTLALFAASPPKGETAAATAAATGQFFDYREGLVSTIAPDGNLEKQADLPMGPDGNPLRNFTVFRSDCPDGRQFFVWDGQLELLSAQIYLNYLWTCEQLTIHQGAFRMPFFTGGWADERGKLQQIILDGSEALFAPSDPLGKNPAKIDWIGPDTSQVHEAIAGSRHETVWQLAEAFHLGGEAITQDNHGAASGYSLRVQKWALNEAHEAAARDTQPELDALVRVIRDVWNATHPPAERFSQSGTFRVSIPAFRSGETLEEELRADALAVSNNFTTRRAVILKHNPDLSAEDVETLAEEGARPKTSDVVALVTAGVLSSLEARTLLGLGEAGGPDAPGVPDPPDSIDTPSTGETNAE